MYDLCALAEARSDKTEGRGFFVGGLAAANRQVWLGSFLSQLHQTTAFWSNHISTRCPEVSIKTQVTRLEGLWTDTHMEVHRKTNKDSAG